MLCTPADWSSGISRSAVTSPRATFPTVAAPRRNAMRSPGALTSPMMSPESELAHCRVEGVVRRESTVPEPLAKKSPPSPLLRFFSRSRCPSTGVVQNVCDARPRGKSVSNGWTVSFVIGTVTVASLFNTRTKKRLRCNSFLVTHLFDDFYCSAWVCMLFHIKISCTAVSS